MIDPAIAGRNFVVTGGTKGVGRSTAELFLAQGANVAVSARDGKAGAEAVAEMAEGASGEVFFAEGDAADAAGVERFIDASKERFGQLDGLIANVGLMHIGTALSTSLEDWRRVLDTNLSSAFYLAKYGVPALEEAGGGTIVLTAGELGLVGARETIAYCAAKGGLVNFTRALAVDCAPSGIRVNCVCPGPIDTPLLREWYASAEDPAALQRAQEEPVLLKRVATADEVAMASLVMSSQLSSYQTGTLILVDGGLTASYGL
jgi:NAD(P)-dependent dehydrogenase (short-subunit alcohol dehydrogenase family)